MNRGAKRVLVFICTLIVIVGLLYLLHSGQAAPSTAGSVTNSSNFINATSSQTLEVIAPATRELPRLATYKDGVIQFQYPSTLTQFPTYSLTCFAGYGLIDPSRKVEGGDFIEYYVDVCIGDPKPFLTGQTYKETDSTNGGYTMIRREAANVKAGSTHYILDSVVLKGLPTTDHKSSEDESISMIVEDPTKAAEAKQYFDAMVASLKPVK